MAESFTVGPEVLEHFATISRISSVVSLVAILFILFSYAASSSFHKPINRLVVYASIGNIFTIAATLMSRSHIKNIDDPMCQLQAFLIQMFMPADAYWTLAMALNVYLTFYYKYDKHQLKRLEYVYLVACYGLPIAPAIVFLCIKSADKGRMYGDATLWCWISNSWDVFRIALFYGPVWLIIFITLIIYARAGKDIWAKRQQLKKMLTPPSQPTLVEDPFTSESEKMGIARTVDVFIDHEDLARSPRYSPAGSTYSKEPRAIEYPLSPESQAEQKAIKPVFTTRITSGVTSPENHEATNPTAKGERKSFITTVTCHPKPSFVHRVHGISPPARQSTPQPANNASPQFRINTPGRKHQVDHNFAIWHYTKVSLLFFCAMMVTWIPSSANRVYSVIHGPNHISVGLSSASALVLPLQGLWNAVIYIKTSFPACRELWENTKAGRPFAKSTLRWRFWTKKRSVYVMEDDRENHGSMMMRTPRTPPPKDYFADGDGDAESTKELQTPSRPGTGKASGGSSLHSS
ncbi:hypothetical protein HYALB_00009182 [Hymenoscyphus albidus]|uniref:G-protein coupled receptors family 2 profile 2 domain-containing protein n=1 Tax=Hymenoscyphus albidus TaxID=595503 RepID=A0A9N9LZG9_9HELO|nr:hypothetical protein HYALB_00009182 [Hymenoscyphus albidus]